MHLRGTTICNEFFSENIVPVSLRDEREFKYQLVPAVSPPLAELRGTKPRACGPKHKLCPNLAGQHSGVAWILIAAIQTRGPATPARTFRCYNVGHRVTPTH